MFIYGPVTHAGPTIGFDLEPSLARRLAPVRNKGNFNGRAIGGGALDAVDVVGTGAGGIGVALGERIGLWGGSPDGLLRHEDAVEQRTRRHAPAASTAREQGAGEQHGKQERDSAEAGGVRHGVGAGEVRHGAGRGWIRHRLVLLRIG